MYRLSLKAQDELLLCTDGLHDMIPDDKLAVILNANATAEGACRTWSRRRTPPAGTITSQ